MRISSYFLHIMLFVVSLPIFAETTAEDNIRKSLEVILNQEVEITRIRPSFIKGLYEVTMGPEIIYVSADGRYVLKGDLLDLREKRNLSEEQRAAMRQNLLDNQPDNEIITFAPAKTEHVIYVFTDVDCGYCRRLHRDVKELNDNGVAVRYLAYPRGGVGSHAHEVMQSVWCSDNQQKALTLAKSGGEIELKQCKNPIEKHYQLGRQFGIRGTPAIYLENGTEVPGYMPPVDLLKLVNY